MGGWGEGRHSGSERPKLNYIIKNYIAHGMKFAIITTTESSVFSSLSNCMAGLVDL